MDLLWAVLEASDEEQAPPDMRLITSEEVNHVEMDISSRKCFCFIPWSVREVEWGERWASRIGGSPFWRMRCAKAADVVVGDIMKWARDKVSTFDRLDKTFEELKLERTWLTTQTNEGTEATHAADDTQLR